MNNDKTGVSFSGNAVPNNMDGHKSKASKGVYKIPFYAIPAKTLRNCGRFIFSDVVRKAKVKLALWGVISPYEKEYVIVE